MPGTPRSCEYEGHLASALMTLKNINSVERVYRRGFRSGLLHIMMSVAELTPSTTLMDDFLTVHPKQKTHYRDSCQLDFEPISYDFIQNTPN